jgi:hypothetical protein
MNSIKYMRRLAAVLLVTPMLAACEGDNLFDGTSRSGSPIVTDVVLLRTTVPQCGNVDVSVDAVAPVAITDLTVLLRFDATGSADETVAVDLGAGSNVLQDRVVTIPVNSAGTARVFVFVTDMFGTVSQIVEAPATVTVTPLPLGGSC